MVEEMVGGTVGETVGETAGETVGEMIIMEETWIGGIESGFMGERRGMLVGEIIMGETTMDPKDITATGPKDIIEEIIIATTIIIVIIITIIIVIIMIIIPIRVATTSTIIFRNTKPIFTLTDFTPEKETAALSTAMTPCRDKLFRGEARPRGEEVPSIC